MISKVKYLGELRTHAFHNKSGEILVTDAPLDNQGKGEAFSPTDLVATALASCMLTIMGIIAKRDGIDIGEVSADVDKFMSDNPRRIGEIRIKIIFKTQIQKKDRIKIERAARSCPVSGSLNSELIENVKFIYP